MVSLNLARKLFVLVALVFEHILTVLELEDVAKRTRTILNYKMDILQTCISFLVFASVVVRLPHFVFRLSHIDTRCVHHNDNTLYWRMAVSTSQ